MKKPFSDSDQKESPQFTGEELVRLRIKFIERGISFARWARMNRLNIGNAHSALTGRRNGPKSIALRARIRKEFSM